MSLIEKGLRKDLIEQSQFDKISIGAIMGSLSQEAL